MATGTFSDKSTAPLVIQVTWKSSNSSIASVDTSGLLTALRVGFVTVTATDSGVSGALGINVTAQAPPASIGVTISASSGGATRTATLNVTNATIRNIEVTPSATTLGSGTTQAFKAVGTFSDGSSQDVTSVSQWTSSATGVATVNQSGVATGASPGQTNVTATFNGVSNTAVLTVQ
jgi:hypothetical protein